MLGTREGHTLNRRENGTIFTIRCSCGWSTPGLLYDPDPAEQLAYEHLTGDVADTGEGRAVTAGLYLPPGVRRR